jgi:radical SAM protein with 4Fe4S-binding SPASM domain
VKTTETCNLNCSHCFTSGSSGAKIYFKPNDTSRWIIAISKKRQSKTQHIEFHGGEPFLAPLRDMYTLYNNVRAVYPLFSFGMTSNLTLKLSDDKLDFIDTVLNKRIATSWDPDIRWDNSKQYSLWESNIALLLSRNVKIKLFISLSSSVIAKDPLDIMKYCRDLGVHEVAFEKITHNGSANNNLDIFPSNIQLDTWIYTLHKRTVEYDARSWFYNEYLESVYTKIETGNTKVGTFCRNCEDKLFTINADGTIAGCPNGALTDYYGTIYDNLNDVLQSNKRIDNIVHEKIIHVDCMMCPVFNICGGDCHRLLWDGTHCPSPKSLMMDLYDY